MLHTRVKANALNIVTKCFGDIVVVVVVVAGVFVVVVVVKLSHRHNAVRGHRTDSNNSEVEEHLEEK